MSAEQSVDIFGLSSLNDDEQTALVRNRLLNLTTSYADEADIFTEIVQNAFDACQLRDSDSDLEIVVVIGRLANQASSHYLYVQDAGVGMTREVLRKFAVPGYTFKKSRGQTVGYKGVGASYFTAVSRWLAVTTVDDSGQRESITVRHAWDWINTEEAPLPTVTEDFEAPSVVQELADKIERGTGVFYRFHSDRTPKTLSHMVRVGDVTPDGELRHWANYLAAKTPLGFIKQEHGPPGIKLRLILDRGDSQAEAQFLIDEYDLANGKLGYPFPHLVYRSVTDLDAVRSLQGAAAAAALGKSNALHKRWSGTEFLDELNYEADAPIRASLAFVDAYYGWSTEMLKTANKRAGFRTHHIRYGIRLAVDGAPQGRAVELQLTSNQGLERQMHVVLGFDQLDLDTGRKMISDEQIVRDVNKIGQRVVTRMKENRNFLRRDNRKMSSGDLSKWRSEVKERASEATVRTLFEALGMSSPLLVDPDTEQEVVALWVSLLSHGLLRGYQTRAISGFNTYDGLVDLALASTEEDHDDPLAPVSKVLSPENERVLEFKNTFRSLVDDFAAGVKQDHEIDIAVCWSVPGLNYEQGSLQPTYGRWSDDRRRYGASYIWTSQNGNAQFDVIALKNLVAELHKHRGAGGAYLAALEGADDVAGI